MNCSNSECGENSLITELTLQGLKRRCFKCGTPVQMPAVEQVATRAALDEPHRVAAPRPTPTGTLTTKSLVRDAKARIVELNREIKKLKLLTQERNELVRLIKAAKQKPSDGGAVVRPLRKQG